MAKKLRILMLVENAPAPADSRLWPEAIALRDQGFQVSVISSKGPGKYSEPHVYIEDIHIYRYGLPESKNHPLHYFLEYGVAMIMTFYLSLKVLFRHGFDVIHTANPPDLFFIIGLFYRLFGKKFVYDQHDIAPEVFQVKFNGRMKLVRRLLIFLEWCSYQTADVVIVVNESLKKIAITRGRCSADKVFVVRNGSKLDLTKPVTAVDPELKRGRRYLMLYIGLMEIQDGIEYALYALHELVHKRNRQDVSMTLIGVGDYLPTLRMLAHDLQLDDYITFTGWVESRDVPGYLAVADIGLAPDPQNGMNEYASTIKTMEYMAMSKPIVAFDLAETRFSAQDAALYAVPNLVEDFANKIEILLGNEALRLAMGASGRKRMEEELGWNHAKKNLFHAYETLFCSASGQRRAKDNA
jgi:glycosyltransferase involved in cell wall biosynthesis